MPSSTEEPHTHTPHKARLQLTGRPEAPSTGLVESKASCQLSPAAGQPPRLITRDAPPCTHIVPAYDQSRYSRAGLAPFGPIWLPEPARARASFTLSVTRISNTSSSGTEISRSPRGPVSWAPPRPCPPSPPLSVGTGARGCRAWRAPLPRVARSMFRRHCMDSRSGLIRFGRNQHNRRHTHPSLPPSPVTGSQTGYSQDCAEMTDRPPRVAQFHHRRHRRKTLCNQDCAVRERLDASVPRTLFRLRVLATCYQHTQYPAIYLLYSELLSSGRPAGRPTRFARFTSPGKSPLYSVTRHLPTVPWRGAPDVDGELG